MEPASSSLKPSARRHDLKKVLDLSASGMLLPYQSLAHEEGSSASGFEGFSELSNTTTSSLLDPSSPTSMVFVRKTRRPAVECTICGDTSYSRHYGVISCEGCEGFFKRTVRRGVAYRCRGVKMCVVDKRLRNRCQYCRFQKCLQMGMKREAIQGRIRARETRYSKRGTFEHSHEGAMDIDSSFASSSHSALHAFYQAATSPNVPSFPILNHDFLQFSLAKLPGADSVLLGPFLTNPKDKKVRVLECGPGKSSQPEIDRQLVKNCEKDLYLVIRYVRECPLIADMPLDDQVALVKCGWNELHLSAMGARAMFANVKHGLTLSSGMCISPSQAALFGLTGLVERMSRKLIAKMTELKVDSFELACLRGIILFNPDAEGLSNADYLEAYGEKLHSGLEEHCHLTHPQDVSRSARLQLHLLPSLQSISPKGTDLLFFSHLFSILPPDSIISRLLQFPTGDLRTIAAEVHEEDLECKLSLVSSNTSYAEGPVSLNEPDMDADDVGPSGSGDGAGWLKLPAPQKIGQSSKKSQEEKKGTSGTSGPVVTRRSKSKTPDPVGELIVRCQNPMKKNAVQIAIGSVSKNVDFAFADAVKLAGEHIPLRTRQKFEEPDSVIGCWVPAETSVTVVFRTLSEGQKIVKILAGAVDSGASPKNFRYPEMTEAFNGGRKKEISILFESSSRLVCELEGNVTRHAGSNRNPEAILNTQEDVTNLNIAATKALQEKQKKKASAASVSPTGLD